MRSGMQACRGGCHSDQLPQRNHHGAGPPNCPSSGQSCPAVALPCCCPALLLGAPSRPHRTMPLLQAFGSSESKLLSLKVAKHLLHAAYLSPGQRPCLFSRLDAAIRGFQPKRFLHASALTVRLDSCRLLSATAVILVAALYYSNLLAHISMKIEQGRLKRAQPVSGFHDIRLASCPDYLTCVQRQTTIAHWFLVIQLLVGRILQPLTVHLLVLVQLVVSLVLGIQPSWVSSW